MPRHFNDGGAGVDDLSGVAAFAPRSGRSVGRSARPGPLCATRPVGTSGASTLNRMQSYANSSPGRASKGPPAPSVVH